MITSLKFIQFKAYRTD